MKKILLDPGHGGADSGASANGLVEKELNLIVSAQVYDILKSHKVDVHTIRTDDTYSSLQARTDLANRLGADAYVSIHHNSVESTAARGLEIYHSIVGGAGKALATAVHDRYLVHLHYLPSRGIKTQTNSVGRDYFHVIRETNMPAIIIEGAFLTNAQDAELLQNPSVLKAEAQAIAEGILLWMGRSIEQINTNELTPIQGEAVATLAQAKAWLELRNSEYTLMADLYYTIAPMYGIRADVALAQAAKETGFFKFGGDVKAEQNNFCGLGATGGGNVGHSFPDRATGVQAHVEHLYAYATDEPLIGTIADPRFYLVHRGSAPYVEWLGAAENPTGTGWAYPGMDYGVSIIRDYLTSMLATTIAEDTTQNPTITQLQNKIAQLTKHVESLEIKLKQIHDILELI